MSRLPPRPAERHDALSQQAYERLEDAIVSCRLTPGRALSILDLQAVTGLGRTPTHHGVLKLAADTLITIRPRHGLQITPIDVPRERTLLELRSELERFVVKLAVARADERQREQMHGFAARLRAVDAAAAVDEFNGLDRQLDGLLLQAAGEPFMQHSLRPLRSMSRRMGWLYYATMEPPDGIRQTLDCHIAVVDGVLARDEAAAVRAISALTRLCRTMTDALADRGDPGLFDCRLAEASG